MSIKTKLKAAVNEKDVENIWRSIISDHFKTAEIISPFGSDGILKVNGIYALLEFKYAKDFTKKSAIIEVLIQCLYYLKKLEQSGTPLPKQILIADVNEVIVSSSSIIAPYLNESLDWSIAPSQAPYINPLLTKKMFDDTNITPFVFEIDDNFNFSQVAEKLEHLSQGTLYRISVTPLNIGKIFNYFTNRVLKNKSKHSANDLVGIFINTLTNPNENYLHPKKNNILVTKGFGEISVDSHQFSSFFDYYHSNYAPSEAEKLTSIADRLIEDTNRRMKGEFYTPTEWVEEAHRMIENALGKDWKEKYIVWDPAWGTGNLTRDYKFKELYCSTINQADLEMANQMGYNLEATKFQYDFLNDDIDMLSEGIDENLFDDNTKWKMPLGLIEAFKLNKPMVIFMNPPYGVKSGFKGNKTQESKVQIMMNKEKMGQSSSQLYSQFFWKLIKIKKNRKIDNINICSFSNTSFLTAKFFKNFRKEFNSAFSFVDGMSFCASHFSNTSSNWAILFSIWSSLTEKKETQIKVNEIDQEGNVYSIKEKLVYNLDDKTSLNEWVAKDAPKKTEEAVPLTNAINVKEDVFDRKLTLNSLGSFLTNTNIAEKNPIEFGIFSSVVSHNYYLDINKENFTKCIAGLTAHKTIPSNWINGKDEYLAPNTNHPDYEQWNNDCIIYSIFGPGANQSSLRSIDYKNKLWNIKNEFFFMSNKEIKDLSDKEKINEIYQDTKQFPEDRFVYKTLENTKLSNDALEILNLAKDLVKKSFQFRSIMIQENPEYHLQAWDAGWYQIKLILKKYMKDDLKAFNLKFKEFENRMREGVYKFGFLLEE